MSRAVTMDRDSLTIYDWMMRSDGLGLRVTSPSCAVYARIYGASHHGTGGSLETQGHLAEVLELSRETVNRAIRSLKERGLVREVTVIGPSRTGVRVLAVEQAPIDEAVTRCRAIACDGWEQLTVGSGTVGAQEKGYQQTAAQTLVTENHKVGQKTVENIDPAPTCLVTADHNLVTESHNLVTADHNLVTESHNLVTENHKGLSCGDVGDKNWRAGEKRPSTCEDDASACTHGIQETTDPHNDMRLHEMKSCHVMSSPEGDARAVERARVSALLEAMDGAGLDDDGREAFVELVSSSPRRVTGPHLVETLRAFREAIDGGASAGEIRAAWERYLAWFFGPGRPKEDQDARYVMYPRNFLLKPQGLRRWRADREGSGRRRRAPARAVLARSGAGSVWVALGPEGPEPICPADAASSEEEALAILRARDPCAQAGGGGAS